MKKVLSLVLALVLVLGMIPTFAADTAVTGAQNLYDNGFITGKDGATVDAKLDVNAKLTRAQLAALIAELNGASEEAAAFAQPADYTDAAKFQDWAKPYIAYAQENGWMNGYPDKSFGADKAVPAEQLASVLLNALGYEFEYATVLETAADLGIVVEGSVLTRGEAFEAMWTAVSSVNIQGEEMTLGVKLGKLEPVTPEVPADFLVKSVTADNLIQAVVTFNQPVDAKTATDKDNYSFATADKIKVIEAALSEDKTQVTLTFEAAVAQQKTASLTVSGSVKSAEGVAITKVTNPVSFLDTTMPTIVSAEVVGVSTIKVTFSEPMKVADKASFKVNDGKYYVNTVTLQKNNTEALVQLYTSLKTGNLPFEVKVGPTDYAGFTAMGLNTTLTVVEDTEAPYVVSFKDAKPNSVVLVWNEDIVLVNAARTNFYHTNASNLITTNLLSTDIDGNEMTLKFDADHKLPNGTAYAYVLKDAVKDLWNNKNAQQMTKVDVVVDNTAPVLSAINFKAEDKIQLVFDESVKDANVRANYTLLDKDGKEVTNIISSFDTATDKKVTITFVKKLSGGDYTLVVKNIKDLSGNAMSSTSMSFTVTDKTAPDASKFTASFYNKAITKTTDQIIKISFGEAMMLDGAYSIADLSKYILPSGPIEDLTDATIAVVDDGKGVEITIPYDSLKVDSLSTIMIARVADAAGNYTAELSKTVTFSATNELTITKARLTGAKEVKVYFNDNVTKFEASEIIISTGTTAADQLNVASVTTELVSGKTVATFTISDKYTNGNEFRGFDYTSINVRVSTIVTPTSTNNYGVTLTAVALATPVATVEDRLAPTIAQKQDVNDNNKWVADVTATPVSKVTASGVTTYTTDVTLVFTENLDPAYISNNSFEIPGFDVVSTTLVGGAPSKTITVKVEGTMYVEKNSTVSLKAPLRDASYGNETATLDTTVSFLPVVTPLTAVVTSGNATGLVLTFSQELYNNNAALADGDVKALFTYSGTAANYTSAMYDHTAKTVTFVFAPAEDAKTVTVASTVTDIKGTAVSATTDVVTFTAAGPTWAIN